MNTQLTSAHRLILTTLILSVFSVGGVYFLSGPASLLVAATLFFLIWLFRPLFMPPGYGAMKIRTLSLIGSFGLAASYSFWSHIANAMVEALTRDPRVKEAAPWLDKIDFADEPSITILIFVTTCLWIVNYYMADRSIGGGHPVPLRTDFPDQSFQKKLDSFCSALRQHLVTTDREANWSPDYYADLEAEVEIVSMAGTIEKKQIVDLQVAMRSDHMTQAFLVLGDPGAGKSVALRKLSKDMLDEVGKTGRIPIYVNLREWLPKEGRRNAEWTEEKKPSIQELEHFVIDNIKARGDVFTEEFVDEYFRDLWKHGRLFFIFDSFDEIPELLDVNEESWLINALSDVLSRFVSSNPQSRGILASRMFRRPTQAFLAQKIFEIRPLSEERIIQALNRFPAFTSTLQRSLFRDRLDLIPIARNPFLMALLGEWVKSHRALPKSQAELYENYLKNRLDKCASKISQYGLSVKSVLRGATEIAWFVFESPAYGLEAPVRVIDEENATSDAIAIIEILSYARIARVTQTESKSFAFVHRRFLEYFVSTRLLNQPEDLPVEHIPTDSRGRDALVLYAQLCAAESANKLANLCWSEIKIHFHDASTCLRAIHSLRFLTEAFRTRRTAISSFDKELAKFIEQHVAHGEDLVQAKICLEGTGLLSEKDALPILKIAMAGNNSWLQETAFRACRNLPKLEPELQKSITAYVTAMPIRQFWKTRQALAFSLSLSESLKDVHRTAVLRSNNLLISTIATPLALAISPFLGLLICLLHVEIYVAGFVFGGIDDLANVLKNRRAIPSSNHTTVEQFKQKLSSRLGHDLWIQSFRMALGISILISGVALASTSFLSPTREALIRDEVFGYLYPIPTWVIGFSLPILGAMILDWLVLRTLWSDLTNVFKNRRLLLVMLGFIPSSFVLGYGAFVGMEWLKQHDLEWMIYIPFLLGGASIFAIGIWKAKSRISHYIRDRRTFKHIAITDRIPREDIANTINSLHTDYWRLAFIRELNQRKTLATGSWPEFFKLSVAADPTLTELAKLEERWLRLDR